MALWQWAVTSKAPEALTWPIPHLLLLHSPSPWAPQPCTGSLFHTLKATKEHFYWHPTPPMSQRLGSQKTWLSCPVPSMKQVCWGSIPVVTDLKVRNSIVAGCHTILALGLKGPLPEEIQLKRAQQQEESSTPFLVVGKQSW